MRRRTIAGRVPAALPALLLLLGACDSSRTIGTAEDADLADVTATLEAAADSMHRRGDTASAPLVAAAAEAVRLAGAVGTVRLALGDSTLEWQGVTQRWTLSAGSTACAPPRWTRPPVPGDTVLVPPPACGLLFSPALVLWRDRGARVLIVSAPVGTSTVGWPTRPAPDSAPGQPTHAVLLQRTTTGTMHGAAVQGSVTMGAPRPAGACTGAPRLPQGATATCARATAGAAFDLTLALFTTRPDPRTPLDTLSTTLRRATLVTSDLPGVLVTLDPGPRVPVVVPDRPTPPAPPPATLYARRDSTTGDVVFRFVLRNGARDTLRLEFPTARRVELVARSTRDSAVVWTNRDAPVAQVASTVRIPPGQEMAWEERWTGPKPAGTVAVSAFLAARDFRPGAGMLLTFP